MKKVGKFLWLLLFALVAGGGIFLAWARESAGPNEYLLTAEYIITMDPETPSPEALWIQNGQVVMMGDLAQLRQESGNVPTISFFRGTIVPGLIEPHSHPIAAAMASVAINVSADALSTRDAIIDALKKEAQSYSPTGWVVGYGWDSFELPGLGKPSIDLLDTVSKTKPVIILSPDMHEAYLNTAAIKALDIDDQTPEPIGGSYEKDAAGHLTGTIASVGAIRTIARKMPKADRAAAELLLMLQLDRYVAAGYTAVGALDLTNTDENSLDLMRFVASQHRAGPRIRGWVVPEGTSAINTGGDDRFAVQGAKYWLDGSPFTGMASFANGYEDNQLVRDTFDLQPGELVSPKLAQENFQAAVIGHHLAGRSVSVDTQGELAIDMALDAFESAIEASKNNQVRHRLEHNALITKAQLDRARQLNVGVSFSINQIRKYGIMIDQLIGERTNRYLPLRWAVDAGAVASISGDHPAGNLAPWHSFYTAVTRKDKNGNHVIGPDQAISRMAALKAMTIDAAWQLGIEDKAGSISVGKSADFVLLNRNPLLVDEEDIPRLRTLQVWLRGQAVDARLLKWSNIRAGFSAFTALFTN